MLFEATGPGPLGLNTLAPPPDDDEDEATMCCCCCEAGGVASMLPGVPVFSATLLHDGAGFRISEVSALLVSSLSRKRIAQKLRNLSTKSIHARDYTVRTSKALGVSRHACELIV